MNCATWEKPSPAVVWRAIESYLANAYHGPPPAAVRARLETLRCAPEEAFYESPVFERALAAQPPAAPPARGAAPEPPCKYLLRLGNRAYPHMKLVIESAPDGESYLLKADTHDAHVAPAPGSREAAAFADLARHNRIVAEAIESAWEQQGLPTFKKFLRDDLARRKAAEVKT